MGIGGSIFLIAIGAIIAFGVHVQMGWLDLAVVGWVLMLAGFVGLVLTLWLWNSRRRRVIRQEPPPAGTVLSDDYTAPAVTERRTTTERRY
jgi:hypothetical protein